MQKVLITGATGMLGSHLSAYLKSREFQVITHGLSSPADYNFDLSDPDSTSRFLDKIKPTAIINLVALTDVDRCEQDKPLAHKLNVQTVENLVAWLRNNRDAFLIHISTDHVYDGPGYKKESELTLTNNYASSKHAAEIIASKVPSTILRTNFFGKSLLPQRKSFSDWILGNLKAKEEMSLFIDVFFNPLLMDTLAEVIETTLQKKIRGVYNVGSHEGMSKCDFALYLAEAFDLPTDTTRKASITQCNLKSPRPKDMRMDTSLFEKAFNMNLPSLKEEIAQLRDQYGT